ncbi:PREDICTED: E3 ubiquitin-protein ligase XIAP isoform X5 [Pseudopodoces humilis]|uniref:E3 ubiquitin-protein ligase XIAP isoform X5 n=1 Tax=Pseudopodoces humilis TaxID=181119 RepID=UPI0006B743B4|nr:PREDICTED: E3 ubiquitin-protein ligase XIAP isoform X5 [Pseudopodoces humilis]
MLCENSSQNGNLKENRAYEEMTCNVPQNSEACASAHTDSAQEWAQEHDRQGTFVGFPQDCPVSVLALAQAGFVYTGEGDKVKCFSCHTTIEGWLPGDSAAERHKELAPKCVGDQVACFCCGGKLKNWEPTDRAWSEHRRHFPKCLFVLGRDVGNISSESIPAEHGISGLNNAQHPRNPSMAKYGKRLQTFLSWIYPVDKEQLAEAGFYSIGNGDHVVCFHCGGGLQEWKENEDPWDQHAKWFPGCRFVSKEKGIEFINNVHLRDGCRDSTTEAAEGIILPKDDLLQNPLVQSAIAMGFSLSEIRNTMEKRLQMTGESHTSVEDLVADLSAYKENTREEEPNEIPVEQDELIQLQNLYLSTEEKLRRLQEEKLCKICMAKDVSVVFIPCGHLVACKECAQLLNECPLCRTDIMKIQEIFMY